MSNNPFGNLGNLDTKLVRPTKAEQRNKDTGTTDSPAIADVSNSTSSLHPTAQSTPVTKPNEGVEASRSARTHARMHARTHQELDEDLEEVLSTKKHLTSYTFRYSSQELDNLEMLKGELNKEREQELSKNDIIRLAVHLLIKQIKHAH